MKFFFSINHFIMNPQRKRHTVQRSKQKDNVLAQASDRSAWGLILGFNTLVCFCAKIPIGFVNSGLWLLPHTRSTLCREISSISSFMWCSTPGVGLGVGDWVTTDYICASNAHLSSFLSGYCAVMTLPRCFFNAQTRQQMLLDCKMRLCIVAASSSNNIYWPNM